MQPPSFVGVQPSFFHRSVATLPLKCCEKPELSVIVGGDITGLDYDEISERIKATTKFDFVHMQKKEDKSFGHVHFELWEKASQFYYSTMEKRFYYDDDKEKDTEITNTGTLTTVSSRVEISNYNDINKNTEMANTTSTSVLSSVEISNYNDINKNERKSPESPISVSYGLYKDNHTFNIVLHTSGIRNKVDLLVSSVSDKLIIIEGNFSEKTVPGKSIKNFLPVGSFKAKVKLPSG
ncbi:14692_t:CDS:2 [Funneliformis geosporum]|uniref:14692_t:CDS:1 n=1 Tax=Funneliformis geosporum TaxID=1117311 RepID=A0A9W4SJW5_9GLOM|nr:14692_t:CDS:2 [Funneliformis geosporum]